MKEQRLWGPTPKYDRVKSYKRPDDTFYCISGPCSVESEEQINSVAERVSNWATHLRGGTFRTGTYPSDGIRWGLVDEDLLRAHKMAARKHGLKNIMEVLDYSYNSLKLYDKYADCFQVGSRQMQNYKLLQVVAQSGKTVFLKRNQGSTLDEFLGAAEHLLYHGCKDVVLIERGNTTFHNHVRFDLSISVIPAVKALTSMPILVDAAHGTGRRDLVKPMTLAGIAAGADGCLIEVHNNPDKSLSDKEQAQTPEQFEEIMTTVNLIKGVIK